jgi:hypothetical protein
MLIFEQLYNRIPQSARPYYTGTIKFTRRARWFLGGLILGLGLVIISGDRNRTPEEIATIDAEAKIAMAKSEAQTRKSEIEAIKFIEEKGKAEAETAKIETVVKASENKAAKAIGLAPSVYDDGFVRYQVKMYSGPSRPVRWTEDAKNFRTIVKNAYQADIDFGGSLTFWSFGCGTSCNQRFAVDKSSGAVLWFPLGGEKQMRIDLSYRKDSALVWASWEEQDNNEEHLCFQQPWVLGKDGFTPLTAKVEITYDEGTLECITNNG